MAALKGKKQKKPGKIIYRAAMAVMIIIFSIAIIQQYIISVDLKKQETAILTEISKEEAIGNSLKNQQENQDDPEFIEKVAREKLNMVKPNEIVFIDKNSK